MSGRFSGHRPEEGADTAGVPWSGRALTGTGFDDDTGEADAGLARVLAAAAAGEAGAAEVVSAVAQARLIVPIVAVPGEVDTTSGLAQDVSSDMAAVTLSAPDGARALPAFTGTAALAAWDPHARPVPVTARRAAHAALQEGCEVIPLDLPPEAGPAAYTLGPSMVWALATGRDWVPAHEDTEVRYAVARAVSGEPAVVGHALSGEDATLRVELRLRPGLDAGQVQELVTRIGEGVAADPQTRTRIEAMAFRLLPADHE